MPDYLGYIWYTWNKADFSCTRFIGICHMGIRFSISLSIFVSALAFKFIPNYSKTLLLRPFEIKTTPLLKTPYSSKIDIFIQERCNKLIYSINTIIQCGI